MNGTVVWSIVTEKITLAIFSSKETMPVSRDLSNKHRPNNKSAQLSYTRNPN